MISLNDSRKPDLAISSRKYSVTLYTPGHLKIIWELFAKESADILSFSNSFIIISRIDVKFYKWPTYKWPPYKWPPKEATYEILVNTGAKCLAILTLQVFAPTELTKDI